MPRESRRGLPEAKVTNLYQLDSAVSSAWETESRGTAGKPVGLESYRRVVKKVGGKLADFVVETAREWYKHRAYMHSREQEIGRNLLIYHATSLALSEVERIASTNNTDSDELMRRSVSVSTGIVLDVKSKAELKSMPQRIKKGIIEEAKKPDLSQ